MSRDERIKNYGTDIIFFLKPNALDKSIFMSHLLSYLNNESHLGYNPFNLRNYASEVHQQKPDEFDLSRRVNSEMITSQYRTQRGLIFVNVNGKPRPLGCVTKFGVSSFLTARHLYDELNLSYVAPDVRDNDTTVGFIFQDMAFFVPIATLRSIEVIPFHNTMDGIVLKFGEMLFTAAMNYIYTSFDDYKVFYENYSYLFTDTKLRISNRKPKYLLTYNFDNPNLNESQFSDILLRIDDIIRVNGRVLEGNGYAFDYKWDLHRRMGESGSLVLDEVGNVCGVASAIAGFTHITNIDSNKIKEDILHMQ